MQIGKAGKTGGCNSTTQLGRPAHMVMDAAAGELYVADGYGNRRVIVFDATHRRLQAPLGRLRRDGRATTSCRPTTRRRRRRSSSAIPCTACACRTTGCVYVCDRANNRIQVFQKDGSS